MKKTTGFTICFFVLFLVTFALLVVSLIARDGFIVEPEPKEPFWQKTLIYQVYPRSYLDQKPLDGTGDLTGIASKADYFVQLGVGTVWLSPIFTSPMADFGYDISNFTDIDPIFGTMADFDHLLQEMHSRDIKLVLDFVPNHSSDEHEWFQKSILKEEPYTDYYIWVDPKGFNESGTPIPPNNWLSAFRGSAWEWSETRQQFYYHKFLAKQPDLNYRNLIVREEMKNVLMFWLDRGADGFRVDALASLFEALDLNQDEPVAVDSGVDDPLQYEYLNHTLTEDQPETFQVLRGWRELLDQYSDRLMMVEVYGEIQAVMKYYGNDTVPLADFPFNFMLIDNLKNRTDVTGFNLKKVLDLWMDNMPLGKFPNWVLGNHDNGRVATRLGSDLVDALNMMTMLLPGIAVTYYGEEIGMEDTFISYEDTKDPSGCNYGPNRYQEFSRDPERTPMQWDNSTFAGFTNYSSTWLPVNNETYETVNVMVETMASQSHLKVYQELVQLRKEATILSGLLAYPKVTQEVFSFVRYQDQLPSYLVVINTSETDVEVNFSTNINFVLPNTAQVVLRSITDTTSATRPGNDVPLNALKMGPGEGLVLTF